MRDSSFRLEVCPMAGAWREAVDLPPSGFGRLEAVATIDRLPRGRPERDLRRRSARRADGVVELARATAHVTAIAASHHLLLVAATATTGGLVLESTFAVERLLSRREHEFLAAVAAFDSLVDISHEASGTLSPLKRNDPRRARIAEGSMGSNRGKWGACGDQNRDRDHCIPLVASGLLGTGKRHP